LCYWGGGAKTLKDEDIVRVANEIKCHDNIDYIGEFDDKFFSFQVINVDKINLDESTTIHKKILNWKGLKKKI
jgi:hypothetical protein